jgi:hypothetical protein
LCWANNATAFGAVGGGHNAVAEVFERASGDLEDCFFVIDHQSSVRQSLPVRIS